MKVIFSVSLILLTVLLFVSGAHRNSKIEKKEVDMSQVDPNDPGANAHIDTSITHWPQLLGKTAEEAEAAIKADRPDLTIRTLSKVTVLTMMCDLLV